MLFPIKKKLYALIVGVLLQKTQCLRTQFSGSPCHGHEKQDHLEQQENVLYQSRMQPYHVCRNILLYKTKSEKSNRLLDRIVDVSLNVSSLNATHILKNGIADVEKSTICNLLKKDIPIPEKDKITKVCIDDFAFKKRHTYGTIMVDIDTRRIIDLLPSREIGDVAEWLSTFPNLEIVSRDGSVSYHSAVKQAGANIIQISDRFHLLKGLTDAAKG